MPTPLADREQKNRIAADLVTVKNNVSQAVVSLQGAKAQLLALKAEMAGKALYTPEEMAEVDGVIAWVVAEVQKVLK